MDGHHGHKFWREIFLLHRPSAHGGYPASRLHQHCSSNGFNFNVLMKSYFFSLSHSVAIRAALQYWVWHGLSVWPYLGYWCCQKVSTHISASPFLRFFFLPYNFWMGQPSNVKMGRSVFSSDVHISAQWVFVGIWKADSLWIKISEPFLFSRLLFQWYRFTCVRTIL